eukprot:scaffold3.g6180.t1
MADLIKRSCDLLQLPPAVAVAALSFYHAFRHKAAQHEECSNMAASVQRTVTACIFLAAKVQEAPLRTNDLVNAVFYLLASPDAPAPPDPVAGAAEPPLPPAEQQRLQPLTKADMLVGEAYTRQKDLLIQQDEQTLLRVLQFRIDVEQPHKYLFCFCRVIGATRAEVGVATCLLNDMVTSGVGTQGYRPAELAAAALHAAAQIVYPERPADGWMLGRWARLGLREADVSTISQFWLALLKSRGGGGV